MNIEAIKHGLKRYPENQVANFLEYLKRLAAEKHTAGENKGKLKNTWLQQRPDSFLIHVFNVVADDGLIFDGDDITLQSTGVSYNYQAYKNKMLLAYPESIIDVSLVCKDDTFQFQKESGKVQYKHVIGKPFSRNETEIIGAYCVIKNNRGEFLTLLSKADIDKHRRVAKTDYIWKSWFSEMALKTVIKKACKQHFKDVFRTIESMDNENYDLGKMDETITDSQANEINELIAKTGTDLAALLKYATADNIESISASKYGQLKSMLLAKIHKATP